MSTFYLLKWFSTKSNIFYMVLTYQSELFCANNFLQKSHFHKKNFLLTHSFWEYFFDYMDLPYQFRILRMSTFCWSQWFYTNPCRICVVHTNVSKLFFRSDLIYDTDIPNHIFLYSYKKAISSHLMWPIFYRTH